MYFSNIILIRYLIAFFFAIAECTSNNDCPYDKACFNQKCLNPCSYGTSTSCGHNAQCLPQNHHATCVCPSGTQGNPLISCITGICQYNEDCPDDQACDRLNRVCRPVCDSEACGDSALCFGQRHQAVCNCSPGTRGNPYIECRHEIQSQPPQPECRVDADCPSQLACFNEHCENPCSKPNVCTQQQTCSVIDTLPLRTVMCRCPEDTVTDSTGRCIPISRDDPECRSDQECSDPDKCVRGTCTLACQIEQCGINALCTSTGHRAACKCAPGYVGNPLIECSPIPKTPLPGPALECYTNDDCSDDRLCKNDHCINPCSGEKTCGRGAFCHAHNHRHVCTCPQGFTGNPTVACVPPTDLTVGCRSNVDCPLSESCINQLCISPCNCGTDAECHVNNHYAVCHCKPGFSGNALIGCTRIGCSSNDECANDKQCYNAECVNPCAIDDHCALTAECFAHNHRAECRCPSGLQGNPLVQCVRLECHSDSDCPLDRSCQQGRCINPCASNYNPPCAQNALCTVRAHSTICRCPDDLPDGNPLSFCERRPLDEGPECTMDYECPSKLACIRNQCVEPCKELSPCAKSAKCSVIDSSPVRTMVCECPELWVPDANGECRQIVLATEPGCQQDTDCPEQETCINRQCRNPCNCGIDAECRIVNRRPVCSCRNGFDGNPNTACRVLGCRIDSECESEKACVNGNCISPCLIGSPCVENAECFVSGNQPQCRCLSGYRGNPWSRCSIVECRTNGDCPFDKTCENSACVNPCVYDKQCAPRAECRAQNHAAVCRCPTGMVGNPLIECRPEIQHECTLDTDCSSRLACLDHKCVNPCTALQPCQRPSRCEVIPSVPVRTMNCICPDGYISTGNGRCELLKSVTEIGGCISDTDCPSDKACINDICRNPCNCAHNAICRIKDHKPVCSCDQGYDGNPEIQCMQIGCRSDDECAGTHSCINRQCVPSCSANGVSCGDRAQCYGINHKAVCECPPGLNGNPLVSCVVLGCRSNDECPSNQACINNKCDNPCDKTATCANTEVCRVYNHRPQCACPPGTVGTVDSSEGCRQLDEVCNDDGDCPTETACILGVCTHACNATLPCGVNAECKALDTIPVRTLICECRPGYQGNAAIQCDKRK